MIMRIGIDSCVPARPSVLCAWHRIGMTARLSACCLLFIFAAFAEAPAFEVASVKIHPRQTRLASIFSATRWAIVLSHVSLQTLVSMAYNVQSFQLSGGPSWIRSRRFDVVAKVPAGAAKSQTWVMLQTLLGDRFPLAVHRETRNSQSSNYWLRRVGPKSSPPTTSPALPTTSFKPRRVG